MKKAKYIVIYGKNYKTEPLTLTEALRAIADLMKEYYNVKIIKINL